EEFVQSIQTFLTDKKSLATESRGKKKSLHLLIPNVHWKGQKGNFGMPIPDTLLTNEIRSALYYSGYLEHVAAYQRYLAEEYVAIKTAKQTKPSAPKATKPAKPVESPKKYQGRKRKPANETTDAPSPAKRSKADEGVPVNEPRFGDEEANMQKAMEESLKDAYPARKGKEKVDEQAAHILVNLQTPKKKSPTEQYIFQRRTPTITKPFGLAESSSLYAELSLTDSEKDSGGNLKLPTDDQVILEEPATSTGTLSSLKHLDREISFTNQFLEEKSQEDEPEKTNTESEVQSMVTVPIHQDTSSVPLMTSLIIDLTVSQPASSTIYAPIQTSTTTTTTSLLPLPPQPQQSTADPIIINRIVDEVVADAVDWEMQAPLRRCFSDLPAVDMKLALHQRMYEDKSYETHEDHKNLFDAMQKSLKHDHSD
ncbi:hypothetical protein Tco_1398451, partial [Tanacetum coccineum]